MQFKGYNDDGLPHDPAGGPRNSSGSPARNYAIGAACIVVAVLSFAFLTGSTAVFIGIAGAVTGAVFLIMGIQASNDREPDSLERGMYGLPETHYADGDRQLGLASPPEGDNDPNDPFAPGWDEDFRRNFGGSR